MAEDRKRNFSALPTPQTLAGAAPDTPVLVALSGGADSSALLHLLAQQGKREHFTVSAAHVNHCIRGAEAERDRDFCIALAKQYGVKLYLDEVDVPAIAARSGTSVEEAARKVRYAFFERIMREEGIPLLVTAHHADDQLETFLFRLCRGTTDVGLCGIAPVRVFAGGYLVRPLLEVTRREILQYCADRSLQYVTDSTNADTAYARNRLRAEVVPVLETLFCEPQRRVSALTEELREDSAYLGAIAREFLHKHERDECLPCSAVRELPPPILRRVLDAWLQQTVGQGCERVHKEAVRSLLVDARARNAEVALPKGLIAVRDGDRLCVTKRSPEAISFFEPLQLGEWVTPDGKYRIFVKKTTEKTKINNLSTQTYIILHTDFDIIKSGLYWRTLKEGDRLLCNGMHKRLRRLYREAGISARERFELPLLCDAEGVLWAPYVGAREGLPEAGERYLIGLERNDKKQEIQ